MIYVDIIVLFLVGLVSYKIGFKRGEDSVEVCQECINDIYGEGFNAGVEQVLAEQEFNAMVRAEKEEVLNTPKKKASSKTAAKSKVAKKSK